MQGINAFITQTVSYATIYTLVTLGIVIAGRTGFFIVAGDGIMAVSASTGFVVAYLTHNWFIGFLVGALTGSFFGLILSFLHERFKVNQFVLGISLVILGTGLSDLIYNLVVGLTLHTPIAPKVPIIRIPFMSGIPLVSGFLNQNPVVYFMYCAIIVSWWFFYKTKVGLETRGIGENPKAIDVVGINVTARRYCATLVGSALIGIAGAYLPLIITSTYSSGIAGGRGSMAIGIAIFAAWKPQRAIIGGFLFAAIEVLAFELQIFSQQIPYQFLVMLPFISILVTMVIFHGKLEFPASLGNAYKRE